jgi:hypothetical protein
MRTRCDQLYVNVNQPGILAMTKIVYRFFSTIASAILLQSLPAAADNGPVISFADKPLRLIRGAVLYQAPTGVVLQKGDVIESDTSNAQIEVSGSTVIALAPKTRIYLGSPGPRIDVTLLDGWLKLQSRPANPGVSVLISSAVMQASFTDGATIMHAATDKGEMFAEEGVQNLVEINERGAAGKSVKINREQYAQRVGDQPIKVMPRPAKEFIAGMPPSFRDALIPVAKRLKGPAVAPKRERDVDYEDIGAWLQAPLSLRKTFVTRFTPRLKDPAFRKQLDADLGQSPEWKAILHPPEKLSDRPTAAIF